MVTAKATEGVSSSNKVSHTAVIQGNERHKTKHEHREHKKRISKAKLDLAVSMLYLYFSLGEVGGGGGT